MFVYTILLLLSTSSFAFRVSKSLKRWQPTRFSNVAMKAGIDKLDLDKTIVVTGMGVISPCGNTVEEFFHRICNGPSAVTTLDRFDPSPFKCQVAAQVRNFDPKEHYRAKKKIKQNDLSCHYAVAAAHMALANAGLSDLSNIGNRVGVAIGSAFGGMDTFERAVLNFHEKGLSSIDPYTIPMILGNTPAGIVAMETGAKGPNFAVQTACATATHAIGEVPYFNYNLHLKSYFFHNQVIFDRR